MVEKRAFVCQQTANIHEERFWKWRRVSVYVLYVLLSIKSMNSICCHFKKKMPIHLEKVLNDMVLKPKIIDSIYGLLLFFYIYIYLLITRTLIYFKKQFYICSYKKKPISLHLEWTNRATCVWTPKDLKDIIWFLQLCTKSRWFLLTRLPSIST